MQEQGSLLLLPLLVLIRSQLLAFVCLAMAAVLAAPTPAWQVALAAAWRVALALLPAGLVPKLVAPFAYPALAQERFAVVHIAIPKSCSRAFEMGIVSGRCGTAASFC